MFFGKTLRVGFALLGLSMAGACAQRELDKKPELAQDHGYFVSQTDSEARGGVGGYIDVPSNSERRDLDQKQQQAGVAPKEQAIAQTLPTETQPATVEALKDQPKTILFDTGHSRIKEESMPALDQIATQLKSAGDVTVKVEGFADKTGNPELNKDLSQDRANCVAKYLESRGAPSDKLEIASYGDEKATSPNNNPEDRKVVLSLG